MIQEDSERKLGSCVHLRIHKPISDGRLVCQWQGYLRAPDPVCKESNSSNIESKAHVIYLLLPDIIYLMLLRIHIQLHP